MINIEAETDIIYRTFKAFDKETGLATAFDHRRAYTYGEAWDGEVKIAAPNQEHEAFFLVEIKRQITLATIGFIANKFLDIGSRGLLGACRDIYPLQASNFVF